LTLEKSKILLAQVEANLDYAKAMLDKTTLYAPFDGVILDKSVEVGDAVSGVSPKTILKIQSLHVRKLILEFDQKYWQNVKIGDVYKYKIDGDSNEYEGRISKIYPYANANNRKIKAEIQTKDFIVGLFGDGTITSVDK
jgi:multidrug resistance efflux pump